MNIDAVFIYINVVNGVVSGAEYQLECAYVRSFLKKRGINSVQYVNKNLSRIVQLVQVLSEYICENYIIYINEYNYYISQIIINKLKDKKKYSKISVFGPMVNYMSREMVFNENIDCYITGSPYEAIFQIINGESYRNISNISFQNEHSIIHNLQCYKEENMDDLGGIYSSGIVPYEEAGNVGLLTSRGCYGKCVFCSYSKKFFGKAHSEEFIINELDYIDAMTNHSPIFLSFFDDCFSINTDRTMQLCREIEKRKYNMQFWACTRADLLNEELIKKMAQCNFKNIVIGFETASASLLEKSGKLVCEKNADKYIKKIEENFSLGMSYGLNPILTMLLGLPGETEKDINTTLNWIKRINAKDRISVCYLTCFPNSILFEHSESYGIKKEKGVATLPYKTYFDNYDMKKVYKKLKNSSILNDTSVELYENTYKLGLQFADVFSGVYSLTKVEKGMSAIFVNDIIEDGMIDFISDNISINGFLVVMRDSLSLKNDKLYTDDRKRLRLPIREYEEIEKKFVDHQKYIGHIVLASKGNPIRVIYDSCYSDVKNVLLYRELNTRESIETLVNNVNRMVNEHFILFKDVKQGIIKNSCRFCGRCTASTNSRAIVSKNGLELCNEKNSVIMPLIRERKKLLHEIQKEREKFVEEQKCIICEAYKRCARCISLPVGIDREAYCKLIQENRYLGEYLSIITFMNKIIKNVDQYSDEVKIYTYLPNSENVIMAGTVALEFDLQLMILRLDTLTYLSSSLIEKNYILTGMKTEKNNYHTLNATEKKFFEKLNAKSIIMLEKLEGY